MRKSILTALTAIAVLTLIVVGVTGFTVVDQTEHCVETRYGKVVNPQMSNGLNWTVFTQANCFTTVDQNYPLNPADTLKFEAQTSDPVTITGTINAVFKFREIPQLYLDKRNPLQAEIQAKNALMSAIGEATQQLTIAELFGPKRGAYTDSIRAIAQRKAGSHIEFRTIYIQNLHAPQAIEAARIAAARKEQELDQAMKQLQIDSATSRGVVIKAEADAKRQELEARALETSPEVLKLKTAEAMARGLANVCSGQTVTTCIIGGSVVDTWKGIRP